MGYNDVELVNNYDFHTTCLDNSNRFTKKGKFRGMIITSFLFLGCFSEKSKTKIKSDIVFFTEIKLVNNCM